jgi:phage terminase large subunit GpA-like protein
LNGLYRIMGLHIKEYSSFLHEFAAGFLDAKHGGPESLKEWTNTFLAETWQNDPTPVIETLPIMKRAEAYTPQSLPNGVIIAVAAVDLQKRWLQFEIQGIGLSDETWGIETKQVEGDPEQWDIWQELKELMMQKFKRQDGVEIPVTEVVIDINHNPERVVNFIKKCGLPRVHAIRGIEGGQNLPVSKRYNRHYAIEVFSIDTFSTKQTIFAQVNTEDPGPAYMHWPRGQGYNEEYFLQLFASEVVRSKFQKGFEHKYYEKIRDRNEALDIRVYLRGAVAILKPNLSIIAKRQLPEGPGPVAGPTPAPPGTPTGPDVKTHSPRGNPRRRIFVGGMGGFRGGFRP